MEKFQHILFLFLLSSFIFGQEIEFETKKIVKFGEITLVNDEVIKFSNLTYDDEKVEFTDAQTQQTEHLFLASIKKIEEGEIEIVEIIKEENLYQSTYPDGVYLSKEEFIQKTPSVRGGIYPSTLVGKPLNDQCFFHYADSNKRIRNVFAVSHQGKLYFQVNAILKNRNQTDRAQTADFKNSFVRVLMGGNNYLYTEVDLANAWAQAAAYGGVGGTAGYYLAQAAIHNKGILWDYRNQEFNIFKNCKDYNKFMQENRPSQRLHCKNGEYHIEAVRSAVVQILN